MTDVRQPRRRLSTGPEEARLLTELDRRGIAVLSLARHREALASFEPAQLRRLVHSLASKGWLIRVERGIYTVVPRAARGGWQEHPFVVAAGLAPVPHYYISYWSALSYHGLTEQLPLTVHVVLRERSKPPVAFQGRTYHFVHRAASGFGDFRVEQLGALNGAATVEVNVATPEQALLDAFDDEHLAGGFAEVAKALRRGLQDQRVSAESLAEAAASRSSQAVIARLGFALEQLGHPTAAATILRPLVRHNGSTPYLSPKWSRRHARPSKRWHLLVNVPDYVFTEDDL